MGELDYPVPRARVEKAFYRYLSETGILLPVLPDESIKSWHRFVRGKNGMDSAKMLTCHIEEYGETNAYMECPFGKWIGAYEKEGTKYMSCLSSRERFFGFLLPNTVRMKNSTRYSYDRSGRQRQPV